jgi:hypothetical protein
MLGDLKDKTWTAGGNCDFEGVEDRGEWAIELL